LEDKVVLSFGDFGGQGCPHIFGDIVLARRDGFSLGVSDDNKTKTLILCLMCIDDLSLIFLFPLHMFFNQ